jgi:hypothetical protein
MKIMQTPAVVEGFAHAGIPRQSILALGIIELSCLALYLVRRTTVLGTLLLTGYLGGAVLANMIGHTDFIHALVVGLFVWAGAWLRVTELRALIPFRKNAEPLRAAGRSPNGQEETNTPILSTLEWSKS